VWYVDIKPVVSGRVYGVVSRGGVVYGVASAVSYYINELIEFL
jgi:hypothetical protein